MYVRILGGALILMLLPATSSGQVTPQLSKTPAVTDTQLSGTAQGLAAPYDAVSLYICAWTSAKPPLDCSAEDTKKGRKKALVNLGGGPFVVNSADGKFAITMASSLVPGTYIWIVQVTHSPTDHSQQVKTSTPVRVPVPLLRKASISLSGTASASRDVGGKVTLGFDHGLQNEALGETAFLISGTYDDKWKSKPLSSNVTQNYSARLSQLRAVGTTTAWGPYASAYHNNTQGIRVEQIYGAGISQGLTLPTHDYLDLSVGMQAMLEDLYSPGKSTNLGGLHMGGEVDHQFCNQTSIDVKIGGTPVFTQDRAWTATGDFGVSFPITRRWSVVFDVVDNYYEIAPKTFNKNYLESSIGFSFK